MSLYYNQKSVLNLVALDANKVIVAAAHFGQAPRGEGGEDALN